MTDGKTEPIWLDSRDAITVHDRQLAEHGGPSGVRDMGALESALSKPVNKWGYGQTDLAGLAASYSFGIARNHPFVDGNKRTAWVLARLFLMLNGQTLRYEKEEAITAMLALAAGEISEEELTDWFRQRLAD